MSAQLPAIKTAAPGLRAVRGRRLAWAKLWPESGAVNPIPALDGLRALAVLLVILFHASTFAEGNPSGNPASAIFYGKTGVQLFYVLSGFLLSLPYAQWFFGLRKRPSTLLFYKRRALRVGPAYWVSLLILGLATAPTIASVRDVALHAVFLSNTTWLSTFSINGVYWTMAIEVQFYALLPLIWLAIYGLARLVRQHHEVEQLRGGEGEERRQECRAALDDVGAIENRGGCDEKNDFRGNRRSRGGCIRRGPRRRSPARPGPLLQSGAVQSLQLERLLCRPQWRL